MKHSKVRTLCEGAIILAIAFILSYLGFSPVQSGGSIDIAMLPIIFFAFRHGIGWGTGVGFIYGILQYIEGNGLAIDWRTIVADYLIAYTLLGLGAGLMKKNNVYLATLLGGILRFAAHYLAGALVWAEWMPEEFLSLPMTSPWIYSLLYNGIYMLPCIAIVMLLFTLLVKNRKIKEMLDGKDLTK